MLTRKSLVARGAEGRTPHYCFFARLERSECVVLQQAQEKAKAKLGGTPSNALLMVELATSYVTKTHNIEA